MKKWLLISVCVSLHMQGIRNPFKGITQAQIKQSLYLWIRPIPRAFKLTKEYPLAASAITIGGIFLYQKDRRAAALYTAILYGVLKYNLDKDIRYRAANEYLMHERQNWHQPRVGPAQMNALDHAVFDPNNDGQDLNDFEEVVIEMAHLDEAGGDAPIYENSNEKEPCSHCTNVLLLPFECDCEAQYCIGCAQLIKDNEYKCLKCDNFMENIVHFH